MGNAANDFESRIAESTRSRLCQGTGCNRGSASTYTGGACNSLDSQAEPGNQNRSRRCPMGVILCIGLNTETPKGWPYISPGWSECEPRRTFAQPWVNELG
jgi:hypothetical protein